MKSYLPLAILQFLDLYTSNGVATTFEEKEKVLYTKFFPPPPDTDLSDIENFKYPSQLSDKGQITVDKVRAAICCPKANKVPGIIGILYLIL